MTRATEETKHEFDTPEPIDLSVKFGQGNLRITAEEVRHTVVAISGRFADQVDVTHEAGKVVVHSPRFRDTFGRGARLDIRITIPVKSAVSCKTGSADIMVTGPVGHARLGSGSGDVVIDEAAGSTVIETGSGAIRMDRATEELQVKSGSGDVALGTSTGDSTTISTGSGDVRIGNCEGPLHAKSGSGAVTIDHCRGDIDVFSSSGDIEIRSAREGRINLRGASGNSRVAIAAGTPVWTDISTRSGRISSELASAGEPKEGQPYVALHITSASGNVTLTEAYEQSLTI